MLISTNLDKVIVYNFFTFQFVRFVEVGYNQIGQIAVFASSRHIAVSTKRLINIIHLPELNCYDRLASDCSKFDAELSLTCNSNSEAVLTPYLDGAVNKAKCICKPNFTFNYISGVCASDRNNLCSDENAHSCTFVGISFTDQCVPNSEIVSDGRCSCRIGFFEDILQGNNRNRCRECTIPKAPCLGATAVDQGVLPSDTVVSQHTTRGIHGACLVQDNGLIGVATIRHNDLNYYSFDVTKPSSRLTHVKYVRLPGTF